MAFINQAVTVLQTLVIALGAGLAVWGVINLMEGYGKVPSRFMRKIVCRLRLSEVSRQ